jgi:hypothetical protein
MGWVPTTCKNGGGRVLLRFSLGISMEFTAGNWLLSRGSVCKTETGSVSADDLTQPERGEAKGAIVLLLELFSAVCFWSLFFSQS